MEQKLINDSVATNLVEKYAKSHGLDIPDALIAATAICHGMELMTYNEKDFKFIENILLCWSGKTTGQ